MTARYVVNLSSPAAEAFNALRIELEAHQRFIHPASASIALEFLIDHYRRTAEHVRFDQFRPVTRGAGRPRTRSANSYASEASVRPREIRAEVERQKKLDRERESLPDPEGLDSLLE